MATKLKNLSVSSVDLVDQGQIQMHIYVYSSVETSYKEQTLTLVYSKNLSTG